MTEQEILEWLRDVADDQYEGYGPPELCEAAADLIVDLINFKQAVMGWREFDHPEGFEGIIIKRFAKIYCYLSHKNMGLHQIALRLLPVLGQVSECP